MLSLLHRGHAFLRDVELTSYIECGIGGLRIGPVGSNKQREAR